METKEIPDEKEMKTSKYLELADCSDDLITHQSLQTPTTKFPSLLIKHRQKTSKYLLTLPLEKSLVYNSLQHSKNLYYRLETSKILLQGQIIFTQPCSRIFAQLSHLPTLTLERDLLSKHIPSLMENRHHFNIPETKFRSHSSPLIPVFQLNCFKNLSLIHI